MRSFVETSCVNDTGLRPLKPSPFQYHHSGSAGSLEPIPIKAGNSTRRLSVSSQALSGGSEVVQGCLQAESLGGDDQVEFQELEIEKVEIAVAGRTFTIVQPTAMDQVLDMYIEQDRLDRDPYWCRLWPSALALVEEITTRPELVKGRSVCDLGAGLGLGGLAAALAGAREVVLYDREPLALACALMTARANGVDVGTFGAFHHSLPFSDSLLTSLWSFSEPSGDEPEGREKGGGSEGELRTGSVSGESSRKGENSGGGPGKAGVGPVLRAELFDWSDKSRSRAVFDVVLACDVLYEKTSVPKVADVLPTLLKDGTHSQAIISDPTDRCPGNRARFVELLEGREAGQPEPRRKLSLLHSSRRTPFMDGEKHNVELLHFG
ncbi:hypothetical protein KFL_000980210 [Klebsormidium nitens]|uniref:Methyltransferase small domain-containing protein n=1 Tax=Klebsormidium nitens TaxID=105231 RepID=A0A0U9HJQ4_KLENI|nr:hypothetical protein KFL_000980210 [Klebsormidium nitens]|eukprot:GAQ82034.1 hypothetical protein KFL_000980210 [Klebsormidium nitens]